MQQLTIAGNVGKDAVLRTLERSGDKVLNFSIAVSNGKDKDGNRRDSTWFDCSLWGKRAEALERYITKGTRLVVTGRPTARHHEGKVYLGCSVDQLTMLGGGADPQESSGQSDRYQSDDQTGGSQDMDDEIPF